MDRSEAVLRELNLYPQWTRRSEPVAAVAEKVAAITAAVGADTPASIDSAMAFSPDNAADKTVIPSPVGGNSEIVNLNWHQLKTAVRDCTICKLRAGCTQTVFGVGDEQADWLFIGEGPGADEDAQGEPFVGQAGKLLDNMLMAIGLKRGKNAYIANIVKCRPPGNRTPAADEIAACLPYLQRQVALIQPKVMVALGKTAATALLGSEAPLGSLRGRLHDYQGIPLIVTYHPAYLLRSPLEKAKTWQDLRLAVATMQGASVPSMRINE